MRKNCSVGCSKSTCFEDTTFQGKCRKTGSYYVRSSCIYGHKVEGLYGYYHSDSSCASKVDPVQWFIFPNSSTTCENSGSESMSRKCISDTSWSLTRYSSPNCQGQFTTTVMKTDVCEELDFIAGKVYSKYSCGVLYSIGVNISLNYLIFIFVLSINYFL